VLLVKDVYLAEDIFQETFMKVIDTVKQGKYKERGKFLPWVLRISHNLVIDYFRKTSRIPNIIRSNGTDLLATMHFAPAEQMNSIISLETTETIRKLIQELPDDQREVLVLRHYANMSFKEIAEMTHTNINTALGRMRYAILGIRKLVEKYNITLK